LGKFDRLKSITVLYVEDSRFLAKSTMAIIEKIFNKVYIAYDGQEALEVLEKNKDEIDIIITDLIMPVLDGINMVEVIRKKGCTIPVVVTTGFNDILAQEKIIELSIEGFLSKPIDMFKLLKRVNVIVDSLFIKRELATKKEMIDNDIIYSETDANGIITYVSKPFEKISGYTKEELIGKAHSILKDFNTMPDLYKHMWQTLKSLKQWQGELRNRRKDGSFYIVNIIISPMYFRKKLTGYSATCIDVTELKLKSQELQAKSKQAAMGEMIAMIAHQWRQPITSIGMISNNLRFDLMMDELDKNILKESLNNIDSHVKYLSNTIDIFRDFLKKSKNKEEFIVTESILEAISVVKEQCKKKNIVVAFNNNGIDLNMNTFKDELIQAMVNILTNAQEALVDNNIADPKIDILCEEDSKFIYIKISDNAAGIDKEVLPKIFTPYFSTKTDKNGTGLGLYMTKTIVEGNLDGTLSVKNINGGAEFTIELPKYDKGCCSG